MIHPTALIHPKSRLDSTVTVGPYAVIDAGVVLGPGCVVGPHVHITGQTTMGANNRFHAGCVIGDAPQDLKYNAAPTRLRIGDDNTFREHVTVHCSNKLGEDTVLGSHNLLMAHSHVGHNSVVGNHVVLANGALLAGHVEVADRVFFSGNTMAHQFCRIGTLALMQCGAAATKDVPPFCIVRNGMNHLCGLNIVGLRRAGVPAEQRLQLKKLYHVLFRRGLNLSQALQAAEHEFTDGPARQMLDFIAGSKRGICVDAGRASGVEDSE
ncbi:MAG: acyl-ACP--UDP-N-acetylglucosamine O-acyltransferase [Pedosphaera sp.]|nr:acyl-ACP--UDP-N-acetylglucosamine O-acyltransferase [Pedosphaera sp.]